MLTWAHERGVKLFLIEPGKPNQNAYIESFNGRFREECLNEHWFTSLQHARSSSMPGSGNTTRNVPKNHWVDLHLPPTPRHSFINQINYPRTLKPGATENGGTSACYESSKKRKDRTKQYATYQNCSVQIANYVSLGKWMADCQNRF